MSLEDNGTSTNNEVAKTVGKGIDAASKFGSFLSTVFGGSLNNIGEIAANQTAFWKYKNALKIQDKVEQEIIRRQIEGKTIHIEPRLGIPLLDAAVEEDDEHLQNLWSSLLANAMDPDTTQSVKKSYVQILKQLDPIDAKIIHGLFHFSFKEDQRSYMAIGWKKNEIDIGLSLRNLERLGLIEITGEDEKDSYKMLFGELDEKDKTKIKMTFEFNLKIKALGWHLLKNCTNQKIKFEDGSEIEMLDWEFTTKVHNNA